MGAAAAGALNALTTRTRVETVIGLQWDEGELILLSPETSPDMVRNSLSRLLGAVRRNASATGAMTDPVAQLEKLGTMLEKGLLSQDEFDQAKAKLLSNL